MASNELRDQLVSLLHWDVDVAAGVAAAITQASNRAEVDTILNDYIPASEAQARRVVGNYVAAKFPNNHKHAVGAVSDEDLKASVFMGVNVKTTVKKRIATDEKAPPSLVLAKKVVNCLKCGKIFDCRQPNGEAMRFLAAGGCCTYCGNRVRLAYIDGSTNDQELTAAEEIEVEQESQAEAEALRDRLVEFDRQAAKRTTVIDDQSDYFAIDSNAWLSDEERAELKRRQAEAEAAAEAAKKRMTVTVDLLGRRVAMDNMLENIGDASIDDSSIGDSSSNAAAIEAAMAATAAEKPHGGGSAAVGYDTTIISTNETKMVPSGGSTKYIFIGGEKTKKKNIKSEKPKVVERLQHDDPFELAAKELADILAPWR